MSPTARHRSGAPALGLPETVRATLFDLDGVLTRTAEVHSAAWQRMFDAFLRERAERVGEPFVPFDPVADYDRYVDGLPRNDGTRSFLASRGIALPEGGRDDPPGTATVRGLGAAKNALVRTHLRREGVGVFDSSVAYLRAVRDAGLRRAVVSSSTHAQEVLAAAGIEDLFEARVDGLTARRDRLAGKPAPDLYLAAARAVGVAPRHAAVFEDALAGVAAARAGGFGLVVGVDRSSRSEELLARGADRVVADLGDLLDGH